MFAGELISDNIPFLHLADSAGKALQEMTDFHVSHLPVVENDKYLGLISEEDLLDADENCSMNALKASFSTTFVRQRDFFLMAVKKAKDLHLSVVPVVTDQYHFLGVISKEDLFRQLAVFTGIDEQGGIIVLEMEKKDFSAGEINRLVESNGAYVTQINSYLDIPSQILTVTIRINKSEVSDIVATLQRHEYVIKHYFGEELYQNELQTNYDHLMNYLNI